MSVDERNQRVSPESYPESGDRPGQRFALVAANKHWRGICPFLRFVNQYSSKRIRAFSHSQRNIPWLGRQLCFRKYEKEENPWNALATVKILHGGEHLGYKSDSSI